jgi:hypothetical protein
VPDIGVSRTFDDIAKVIAAVGVTKTVDNTARVPAAIDALTKHDVLVGVPAAKAGRQQGPINNAMLAYIHNFGSPAHNIPARPFMTQGIAKARPAIIAALKQAGTDALQGDKAAVMRGLAKAGMAARNAVVAEITAPDPAFAPLRPATIRARLRKTAAGRRKLRGLKKVKEAAGWSGMQSNAALSQWAGEGNITALLDTGQLRASITYVVR